MTSIRDRLLALLLPGLVLALAGSGLAVYWIVKASLIHQVDRTLEMRAQTLASTVKLEPQGMVFEFGDAPAAMLEETYFELRAEPGVVVHRSSNLGERTLQHRVPAAYGKLVDDADLADHGRARVIWLWFRPGMDADDWEGMQMPSREPDPMILAAATDRRSLDDALATLRTTLMIVGSVVGLITLVLAAIGVRWGLAPLNRLRRQLGMVDGESIGQRFDQAGAPRELTPVYRELNGMLDRVEQTIERERSFADAAAHELRTPLAELRSTTEVALRWPDAIRTSEALRETLAIGGEMERLVESLLLIGRRSVQAGHATRSAVALAPLVRRCLHHERDTVSRKRLHVCAEMDDNATLPAPPEALEIITRNLIGNAAHYTPVGGSIAISIETNGSAERALVVENGPVDLRADDVPRLFEAFWRADAARSSREHVGLGLTVVDRIARTVGLHVDATLAGDRLRIRVSAHV